MTLIYNKLGNLKCTLLRRFAFCATPRHQNQHVIHLVLSVLVVLLHMKLDAWQMRCWDKTIVLVLLPTKVVFCYMVGEFPSDNWHCQGHWTLFLFNRIPQIAGTSVVNNGVDWSPRSILVSNLVPKLRIIGYFNYCCYWLSLKRQRRFATNTAKIISTLLIAFLVKCNK